MSENHSISYRPITRRDYPALERFIDRLSPGRCPADAAAMHLNRLCLYDNLCQSTYAKAAVLGPRIAGLILGRLCKSRGLYPAFFAPCPQSGRTFIKQPRTPLLQCLPPV